ncbi:MAG TPA: serine/threonine-protein kinase [Kofleriaceae bacterium]
MSAGNPDDTLLDGTAGETTAGPTIALRPADQQVRRPDRKAARPTDQAVSARRKLALIPTELENPRDALLRAEIARTRLHVPIIMILSVAALITLPLVGGWRPAKIAMVVAVGVGTGCALWLLYLTREVRRYREGSVLVLYLLAITSMFVGVYFWGVFSPATTVIVMELFFVGVQRHSRVALTLYLTCAAFQGVLSGLIIFDVVPDHGIMQGGPMTTMEAIAGQGLVQVVYLITYLMARATRREIQRSTIDLHRAVEAVFQREVLLDEARQQLDHAIRVGGAGRLTGQPLGSFQLGAIIGRGAMGEVYDAVHVDTGRPAAVKVLHPLIASSEELLTRFLREAQAVVALQSPYIVRLLEVCTPASPTAYYAMERLRGMDLAEKLRATPRLPVAEVVTLVEHVAHGLDVARAAGIVHRDIKPQNLMHASVAGREQVWKILDFGVSHLTEHGGTLTHGQLVGTPMYMAPEQAKGEPVDHRADVYGLCAVAYRAMTGQPPHPVREVTSILYHVVNVEPRPPSSFVDVPAEVDRVMALGMAKDRAQRFTTALELAAALRTAAGS